jgi:DNA polymerase-3 subunit delta
MKLTPEQLLHSLKNGSKVRKFILYGPEESVAENLKKQIVKILKSQIDLEYEEHTYQAAKEDLFQITDSLAARSLFGGEKLLVIEGISGVIPKAFIELCNKPIFYGYLVILAGDLSKTSPLRKLAESATEINGVACYSPDEKTVLNIIRTKLQELGMQFSPEIPHMIASMLPANQLIIESELEKLAVYKGDDKRVQEADVDACLTSSAEILLEELAHALISKDPKLKALQLNQLAQSDINFILVIRALMNFFNRLLQLWALAEAQMRPIDIANNNAKSKPEPAAVSTAHRVIPNLRPPVFYRTRDNMMLAARNFTPKQTKLVLRRLIELERRCKIGQIDRDLLLQHFLLLAI